MVKCVSYCQRYTYSKNYLSQTKMLFILFSLACVIDQRAIDVTIVCDMCLLIVFVL